ncbi:BirA family biotin operon repressor/biotin-[acetyl-CoA-carboxylase] ligase [Streptomyces sp. 3211.6]|uniref:biotin--[acetyl-CoA-carboxylase] ligase n=1 Tax=Streptomyces TaxID=1883 RepID=UPI0009A51FBA|nr:MULTISPECIES: biotin--[acetyl-CoA-carboxylase] ligase [Streptomyces]RKT06534.1 BirA family biotin operon repressor/biotin-[acetyl-CoA-carboxylase] ligase [Streptomyces sp. 3211.6]RPF45932.1 BirA family biotin operon repressor/biotin-[acetyl-CoA-carboxylase] ligase [Streptomyces sp. Ag109_G2-6]
MTPQDASAGATPGRWSNLDRPPLNASVLSRALVAADGLWTSLEVVASTGSTNTDLAARAAGLPEGAVLVAEEQTAGRGRLDRSWVAPARSGLFFSVLLKPGPGVPEERWAWLALLAGVATATGLSRAAGVDTLLKWPNDLLVTVEGEERKAGGILAERVGDGVVIGIGLNVTLTEDELPVPTAGSLALAKATVTDREPLLKAVLRSLEEWYGRWRDAAGDPGESGLQETYAAGCATLGRHVRADLPGGRELVGTAEALDTGGHLVIRTAEGERVAVGAGDVVHLRQVR